MAQNYDNLKEQKRVSLINSKKLKIQNFGALNDYPQKAMLLRSASTTATSCINVFKNFVYGQGFLDENLAKQKANKKQTFNKLLRDVVDNFCELQMFFIHINYNLLGQPVNYTVIPSENCRFGYKDDTCKEIDHIAIHPDWAKYDVDTKQIKDEDITRIKLFNPNPQIIREQIINAGGIENYKGQVYVYSIEGNNQYSLAYYDAILSDINTEGAVSTVKNRNVRNNFITAGVFVEKITKNETTEQDETVANQIKGLQGDMNAFKIATMQISTDEEKPEFIEFPQMNGDKLHELTESTIKANIKEHFAQPGILRGELVAGKLGNTSEVSDLYNYYNVLTQSYRDILTEAFRELLKYYNFEIPVYDYSILPKQYISEKADIPLLQVLGVGGLQAMQAIIIDPTMQRIQKVNIMTEVFGLTQQQAEKIIV